MYVYRCIYIIHIQILYIYIHIYYICQGILDTSVQIPLEILNQIQNF